jgi:hypothetical protein
MSEAAVTTQTEPLGNSAEARDATGALDTQKTTTSPSDTQTKESSQPSDKPTDSKSEPEKKDPSAGPPEKYDFKLPEGSAADAAFVEEVTPVFKELGLSNDQAQKLVEIYNKKVGGFAEGTMAKFQEIRDGWRNDVLKDPTLSDGKDLKPEVRATLGRAIDSMGPELAKSFRTEMDNLGIGDNPTVIRGLLAIAQQATEGRPVRGNGPAPTGQGNQRPETGAKALYPNLP